MLNIFVLKFVPIYSACPLKSENYVLVDSWRILCWEVTMFYGSPWGVMECLPVGEEQTGWRVWGGWCVGGPARSYLKSDGELKEEQEEVEI